VQTVAERHREVMDRTPVSGRSPRGFVTVERNERGEVDVRLRADTLQRLTEAQLADEITAALQAAMDDYGRKGRETLRRLAGTDI
jgi:DNA-binding protein YbaB